MAKNKKKPYDFTNNYGNIEIKVSLKANLNFYV